MKKQETVALNVTINSQTGTGLAGATVPFFRGSASGRVAETPARNNELTTITDNDGVFEINEAPTGVFSAEVSKNGFFIRKLDKLAMAEGPNEITSDAITLSPVKTYIDNQVSDEAIDNFRTKGDKNGK